MLSSEFVAVFTTINTEQFLPPEALLVDTTGKNVDLLYNF
jgi:hypothetical protein